MTTATKTARTDKNGSLASEAELAAEIEGLRKDLSALTDRFAQLGEAGMRTAADYSRETRTAAREKGEAVYADISARASAFEREASAQIRRHPLQALGMAAGIGFLAALITRR
ncbi:hypothetical protein [Oricola sp.]|uniref:DUF883 family protein n=1 Tax=Oricola sp. TaxID=1979950 RepID=UPI0025F824EB|nr:hypothetical protein [Oricola sp.]MCI5074845.1 hypothetical protein [Oricola sp.]